jgi:hypothetical protein
MAEKGKNNNDGNSLLLYHIHGTNVSSIISCKLSDLTHMNIDGGAGHTLPLTARVQGTDSTNYLTLVILRF